MSSELRTRATAALDDPQLQWALVNSANRFASHRSDDLSNLDELRHAARATRNRAITNLPAILDRFAEAAESSGARVHWAADAAEANATVLAIAERHNVRLVVKSKSMLTEEIELNHALEGDGIEVVETDLGEWIIQLADEPPSHILGPALHKSAASIAELFNSHGGDDLSADPEELCAFARTSLREKFLDADMGITGCNFAVAETGTVVIVTNEGNARMVTSLPPVHVVLMGMERVVEDWEQLDLMITLLGRSATGQPMTGYLTQITGPRHEDEVDGPDELHIVVVDNGRLDIIGTEFQEMLHCIRCGSCLNVCPVYRQIGGHAYDSIYSGPMGAILSPLLAATGSNRELANASTLCGACHDACPVDIPLEDLLLRLRQKNAADASTAEQQSWKAWAETWSRPSLYRASITAARGGRWALPSSFAPIVRGRKAPQNRGSGNLRKRLRSGKI